jgi:hypothetical protein
MPSATDEIFNPINSRVGVADVCQAKQANEKVNRSKNKSTVIIGCRAPTIGGADETDSIYQQLRPLSFRRSDTFIFHSRPMLHESITSESTATGDSVADFRSR